MTIDVYDLIFKNVLSTQVLTLVSVLLLKITSSNFREMSAKVSSYISSKYLYFDFCTLKVLITRSWFIYIPIYFSADRAEQPLNLHNSKLLFTIHCVPLVYCEVSGTPCQLKEMTILAHRANTTGSVFRNIIMLAHAFDN